MKLRLALLLALAGGIAFASPARVSAANECSGIPKCIPVSGPWVSVPATGEVMFALQCPQNRGIIGGLDAQATSLDVRATFDGIIAAPVAFGRTTLSQAMFRAVSATHKPGSFKPFIGCIPTSGQAGANTISSKLTPVGPPLDLRMVFLKVTPGYRRTTTVGCPGGEALVDGWGTPAFTTTKPPDPKSAATIHVQTKVVGTHAVVAVTVSNALPRGAGAEVQVGVRCARG
jgi:hypothetical protein